VKQFAPACERNQDAILAVLREILPTTGRVLEIGSGTGQHAAYFSAHLPHLAWQPTDLPENFASIRAWADEAALPNLRAPLALDVYAEPWPVASVEAVVCINTVHIVAWRGVHVDGVETGPVSADLGEAQTVVAQVSLGSLSPDEVSVQLLHGPVGQNDELVKPDVTPMAVAGDGGDGHLRFTGTFTCERPGRYGYTVRVVPDHADLVTPVELGLVASAL